ncbi:vomeronasal type-2 receptor 26-like [Rhinophrynus dorsalis]
MGQPCVDYRKLNDRTVTDAYLMTRVDELLDRLAGASIVSTLDLSQGYWQIHLTPKAVAKSVFNTPFACAYLDDIAIFSDSWEEHLLHVEAILGRITHAGLTIRPHKFQIWMGEVQYLGHRVGGGQQRPDMAKITAILEWPIPWTKKQVLAFLGTARYYMKLVPQYSTLAKPLTDLTKKALPRNVDWSPAYASNCGLGAILSQVNHAREENPNAYLSRKLLPREAAYAAVEKECLALTPISQCSENCSPGYRKVQIRGKPTCCYDCVPCSEGEISNTTDSANCQKCPEVEWPNEKKDRCVPKIIEFLSYSNDSLTTVFSFCSVSFSILTAFILGIFIFFIDTPIVKANNQSLSFVLLVSIMLSFLCVFLFLGRPVDITCMLRQISFGVTFSLSISSLLAKAIIVCIAFKVTKPDSVWRKWISFKLSNSIVLILSSIQVLISVSWLATSPPFQELNMDSDPGKIIVQCNEGSVFAFYSVLSYMGLLAAVSFIVAFFTRTLPDSFNEAKYITFSMLVFCSVWIAMIPVYLSTKGKYMVSVEVFAILASNCGLLCCIFFPKCYLILFRPEMNTKMALLEKK